MTTETYPEHTFPEGIEPFAPEVDGFDWGEERSLEERVQAGAVRVSALDLVLIVTLGLIGPASAVIAMAAAPWYLAPGLLVSSLTSLALALRHNNQVDILGQLEEMGRQLGSLRARWSRG